MFPTFYLLSDGLRRVESVGQVHEASSLIFTRVMRDFRLHFALYSMRVRGKWVSGYMVAYNSGRALRKAQESWQSRLL